jgi:hypothetical protein
MTVLSEGSHLYSCLIVWTLVWSTCKLQAIMQASQASGSTGRQAQGDTVYWCKFTSSHKQNSLTVLSQGFFYNWHYSLLLHFCFQHHFVFRNTNPADCISWRFDNIALYLLMHLLNDYYFSEIPENEFIETWQLIWYILAKNTSGVKLHKMCSTLQGQNTVLHGPLCNWHDYFVHVIYGPNGEHLWDLKWVDQAN